MTMRIAGLFARSRDERRLLAHAFALHAFAMAALRMLPFDRVRRWGSLPPHARRANAADPATIAWAVKTVAFMQPFGATCLSQVLTAQRMLAMHGHASTVCYGIAPAASPIRAHAWLESDGVAVLDTDAGGYVRLLPPGAASR